MQNLFDLKGQVAIVTGSSRGIGRAAAEIMASQGAKVVISSRKAGRLRRGGGRHQEGRRRRHRDPCNISSKENIQALVDGTLKAYGRLDTLVCNAAVNPYFGPLANIPDEAFDKIMASNIKSNLWLSNAAAPHIAKAGGGSIVIVSSIGGLRGSTMLEPTAFRKRGLPARPQPGA